MADTRTISDEETTLDQLTEKASAAASDLLLTRDAANEDYKIKAETLAEYIASGSIAAGEKKAVNGATLKTALDGKQAAGNYQPAGDYVTETALETTLNDYETSEHAGETYATKTNLDDYIQKGSINGIASYPTTQGIYRVTAGMSVVPNTSNYGILIISGKGYIQHTYYDVVSKKYFIANTESYTKPTSWQELVTKQNMSYTRELDNAFIIDINTEFGTSNQPALVKYGAINVPDGFQCGARTVKWCSSNLIFLDMDWIKSDGSLHKSIALYMNGNWIGWKEL